MNVNAKYKNSVFSLLFNNPEALRELYSAIEGVVLPSDTSIDINTLSGVLYMDQLNDLSFTIGNLLVVQRLRGQSARICANLHAGRGDEKSDQVLHG